MSLCETFHVAAETKAFHVLSSDLCYTRAWYILLIISIKMVEAMNTADFLQLINIGMLPLKRARCANKVDSLLISRQPFEYAVHRYVAIMICQGSEKPNINIQVKRNDERHSKILQRIHSLSLILICNYVANYCNPFPGGLGISHWPSACTITCSVFHDHLLNHCWICKGTISHLSFPFLFSHVFWLVSIWLSSICWIWRSGRLKHCFTVIAI